MYYFNEYDYVLVYRIVCFNHFCQQFDISKYWKTRKHTATMVFTFYIQTTSVVEEIADFLLSFTRNFVVSVRRSFLFLCVLWEMLCTHLGLPYNYFAIFPSCYTRITDEGPKKLHLA